MYDNLLLKRSKEMDALLDNEILSNWLIQYGSIALFFLLVAGIIILPVPEETLMVIAGVLMKKGSMHIPFTLFAAYAGSICGITISYLLGRTAGHYLVNKYGSWIGINHERLEQVHAWFEKFGKWTLAFGYFIPGVRHFTGFASGMTELEYRKFALFAYTGAVIWVSTFLSFGYFFGNYCCELFENMDVRINQIIIFSIIAAVLYVLYKKLMSNRKDKS